MQNKFVLLGRILNFITLVLGLVVGFYAGTAYSARAHAQTLPAPSNVRIQHQPAVEEITPGVTTGSFGAYVVLAHTIQADGVVVNGYDLIKLHQNTLNYLAKLPGANQAEIQSIISNSVPEKLYTVKPAQPTQAPSGGAKP